MDELKPCPFCGGKAEIKDWTCGYESGTTVYCIQCGASVNDSVVNGDGWHDRTIIAWNRRAAPGNNPLSLEQLKQKIHKPVYVVDGNVRTWTLLDRISDDFAYFTESSKCSVGLTLEGLNKAWFPYNAEK